MTAGVAADAPLLVEALPRLAAEIEDGLRAAGTVELAAQVPELRVTLRCTCEVEGCSSFHTGHRPMVRWMRRGRQVEIPGVEGAVTVDVVGGEIVYVEVLFRDDVRTRRRGSTGRPGR